MLKIKTHTLGIVQTSAYLIGDTETHNAILIDPVDEADVLLKSAQEENWTIKLILATHAHFDHVLASKAIKAATNAPFYIHKNATKWLDLLPQQGRLFGLGEFPQAAKPDRLLDDQTEIIELDAIRLETIYTPGHSDDHLAYFLRDQRVLFAGDTLFAGSIGRTDLPGGNYHQLMQSITQKLLPLGDDVQVLAGHTQPTTLEHERKTNPFILDYLE
ncbi:MAG: MBL fold metallo-hydrolase [Chloroflexi bacterium]|nr:MAG: MBL fold metallo-hydrolase [Chloroflexota bacterium]